MIPRGRSLAHALLDRASVQVVATWPTSGASGVATSVIEPPLARLVEVVAAVADGAPPAVRDLSTLIATHRLVDRLEASLLALQPSPEPEVALALVRALAAVREALALDCAHRFADRLSGPEASELVVELAHDMRSTVGSVLFLSDLLRSGGSGPVTPLQQRQLGLVYGAAFALSALVSDVMELARGGHRLLERVPVPVDVAEVVRQVFALVQPMAEEKGLALTADVPVTGVRSGHPAAVQRVLLNLLANAIKFTDHGGVTLTVTLDGTRRLHFAVTDTGRGIPPEVQAVLTEPFRPQVRRPDGVLSTAGIGLAMCRRLLDMLGSELRVVSSADRGTQLSFILDMPPVQVPAL
jgi:signal transduction histidine kinase